MTNRKFYIVTHVETYERSEEIDFLVQNCLGIWTGSGRTEGERKNILWARIEKYLGTKLKSLEYEDNKPHALTSYM
tara:strand:+ start:112 stop:339 length:228 start_codon:yes stop_codon:yes gene_type:complete